MEPHDSDGGNSENDCSVEEAFAKVFGGKEVLVEPDQSTSVVVNIRRNYQTEPFSPYQTINS